MTKTLGNKMLTTCNNNIFNIKRKYIFKTANSWLPFCRKLNCILNKKNVPSNRIHIQCNYRNIINRDDSLLKYFDNQSLAKKT